ncbi:MAG TPA: hypothetical protein VGQ31_06210 [Candidatus Limnocylindrales bacterium]|nr:hypothetical protein [Candidatus Limnocylindrales bacterium]
MRRLAAAILAALVLAGLFAPAAFAAPSPKVVFIVGPAGAATDGYRTEARAAARVARRYTPNVIELYSPDATWPAVKQALAGASLVVYMGHGNGWPSIYRDALYTPSEDGFGLNPAAGGDDSTHQYFGEASIAAQVKLAKNAVVLLNHLCYASGLSEPDLPEGTIDQAKQRIDNYAAGFIKAGAAAVVAEAWSSPSYMVGAVLGGGRSIQAAWQGAPSANGHRSAFPSTRSPGYVDQMDTETATAGFTRSIVMKAGLAPKDVLAGATGASFVSTPALQLEPSLASTNIALGAPTIAKLPAAGTTGHIDVPFTIKNKAALKGLEASVRWDPIDPIIAPTDPAAEVSGATGASGATDATGASGASGASGATGAANAGGTAGDTSATGATGAAGATDATGASGAAGGSGSPASVSAATDPDIQHDLTTGPTAPAAPAAPKQVAADPLTGQRFDAPSDSNLALVVPEQIGDVVAPAGVTVGKKALNVPVTYPSVPGRYRLTISLHDKDGVAYDATTQAMIPSLIVRVTGDFDGAISAAPTAAVTADTAVTFGVKVTNLGQTAWGHDARPIPSGTAPAEAAYVVGRWIPLSVGAGLQTDPSAQVVGTALPLGLKSGANAAVDLQTLAPPAAGDYLLLLDIVTPDRGSLVASGADPTLIRVTVSAAPTP